MAEIDDLNPDLDPTPEPKEADAPLGESGKKALEQERTRRKELEKQIKQYEELKAKLETIDLEEYAELKQLKEKTEQEKQISNQKFKELAETKQKALDAQQAKTTQLEKQLAENSKKTAIQKYYYQLGGKEDNIDATAKSMFDILYENVLKDRIQAEADGSLTVLDVAGLAEDRGDDGKPKTPKDLIVELTSSTVWGHLFEKPDIRGTGITQGVKGRGGTRETFEEFYKRSTGYKLQ
jgi:hypothetical protein